MRDRYREGPKPELRRPYPRQCPWMAPVDNPEGAEGDDTEAGAKLDLPLPFDEGDQQCEGQDYQKHCE